LPRTNILRQVEYSHSGSIAQVFTDFRYSNNNVQLYYAFLPEIYKQNLDQ